MVAVALELRTGHADMSQFPLLQPQLRAQPAGLHQLSASAIALTGEQSRHRTQRQLGNTQPAVAE